MISQYSHERSHKYEYESHMNTQHFIRLLEMFFSKKIIEKNWQLWPGESGVLLGTFIAVLNNAYVT